MIRNKFQNISGTIDLMRAILVGNKSVKLLNRNKRIPAIEFTHKTLLGDTKGVKKEKLDLQNA